MIAELGHFALILALFVAAAQIHPLLCRAAALLQFLLCAGAFAALIICFIVSDFTVVPVVEHSHTLTPLLYKIAGSWAGHEGAMSLWLFMLSLFGALSALRTPEEKTMRVHGMIGAVFIAYTLFAANPFERIYPGPFDGMGLAPLLQHPVFALHMPLLYMGFAGFAAAFCFGVAALWNSRGNKQAERYWAAQLKPWVLLSWTALSGAIALGTFWAYETQGTGEDTGGAWIPALLDNAAFIPWLLGTALLHTLLVMTKYGALKRVTVLLALLTFWLAVPYLFFVPAGVPAPWPALATAANSPYILAIPAALLLVLIAGGLFFPWGDAESGKMRTLAGRLKVPALAALVLMGIGIAADTAPLPDTLSGPGLGMGLGIGLGGFVIASALWDAWTRFKGHPDRLFQGRLSQWGLTLAHCGLGLAVIGLTGAGFWQQEKTATLASGESMTIGHYEMQLENARPVSGPHYTGTEAVITARPARGGKAVSLILAQHFYPLAGQTTGAAATHTGLSSTLYVALQERQEGGWQIQAKIHPYLGFLWLGFIMIIAGGLACLTERHKWDVA